MNYTLTSLIGNVDYSEYLQLPLSVQVTRDETLDIASFSLNFMAQKAPLKQYSLVKITATQDEQTAEFILVIESDNVEETQFGASSYYNHNIKCVELTQFLSTYKLPDLAITQPITAFMFPLSTPSITADAFNPIIYTINIPKVAAYAYSYEFGQTYYNIKTKYIGSIKLLDSVRLDYFVKLRIDYRGGSLTTTYYTGNIEYTYYYKLHTGSTWTVVPSLTNWEPSDGVYDIKAVMNDFTVYYKTAHSGANGRTIWTEASAVKNINQVVLFENVEVASVESETDVYTIEEAINKVISAYIPREIGLSYTFLTLDEDIISRCNLDLKKCPEMTITNGRTMFEVFADIGREFNGIPRLIVKSDNLVYLTFDILDNPEDNPNFNDSTELEAEQADMTNYSNGLISDVTNMTSAERTKIFPGKDRFISARVDPSENSLNYTNCSILLDDNIYYIVKVSVKNWLTADLTNVADITDYVKEKTLYNALNNNADGKGLALCYTRGTNKIIGLGQLPNTQNLLGFSATTFIIQRILAAATNYAISAMADIRQYQYNVEYVPYVDTRLTTFQSNIADFAVNDSFFLNYNQETSNINAELFGSTAQKIVSRLGNNDISKSMQIENIGAIPVLGEHKFVGNEKYYASVINIEFNNNIINLAVQYSKDFNKINNRVGIDKKYREYSLYADNFVNRTININDFCEVTMSNTEDVPEYYTNILNRVKTDYLNLLHAKTLAPAFDAFALKCYQSDGTTLLQYKPYGTNTPINLNSHILSANCLAIGNSLNWTASCYDNFSVGQYIEGTHDWGSSANKDARYVDDYGELPIINLSLTNIDELNSDTLTDSQYFPILSATTDPTDYLFLNRKFVINKDNRERLKFNYAINWYTRDSRITIHKGAIKYLYTAPNTTDISDIGNITLVGYNGNIKNFDILNFSEEDILYAQRLIHTSASYSYFHLITSAYTPVRNYDGYAIVWRNTKELLFSFADALTANVEKPQSYLRFNFINKQI